MFCFDMISWEFFHGMAKSLYMGKRKHPQRRPWPPENHTIKEELERAIAHIKKYEAGEVYDDEGFHHLHNAGCRIGFVCTRERDK